jgi:hypothetical protein
MGWIHWEDPHFSFKFSVVLSAEGPGTSVFCLTSKLPIFFTPAIGRQSALPGSMWSLSPFSYVIPLSLFALGDTDRTSHMSYGDAEVGSPQVDP